MELGLIIAAGAILWIIGEIKSNPVTANLATGKKKTPAKKVSTKVVTPVCTVTPGEPECCPGIVSGTSSGTHSVASCAYPPGWPGASKLKAGVPIQDPNDPHVYKYTAAGTKRWVTSASIAFAIWGSAYPSNKVFLSTAKIAAIPNGPDITTAPTLNSGLPLKKK